MRPILGPRVFGRRILAALLPETRQIIVRSRGRVRHVTVSRAAQLAVLGVVVGAVGWTVFASSRYVDHYRVVDTRDRALAAARSTNLALSRELSGRQAEVEDLNARLDERAAELAALAADREALSDAVGGLTRDLALSRDVGDLAESDRSRLDSELRVAETRLAEAAAAHIALEYELADRDAALASLAAERNSLSEERQALLAMLDRRAGEIARLTEESGSRRQALDDALDGLLTARADRDRLGAELSRLTADLRAAQTDLVELSHDRATARDELARAQNALADARSERDRLSDERERLDAVIADARVGLGRLTEDRRISQEELDMAREALAAMRSDRDRVGAERDGLSTELAAVRADLVRSGENATRLERALTAAQAELRDVDAQRRREIARRTALEATRSELEGRIAGLIRERDAATASLTETATARDAVVAAHARLSEELQAVEGQLSEARAELAGGEARRGGLLARIDELDAELRAMAEARGAMADERDTLDSQVVALERQLAALENGQRDVVARLHDNTGATLELFERTLDMAGLDADRLLRRTTGSPDGVGGPLRLMGDVPGAALGGDIAALDADLARLTRLRRVMAAMPLTPPLDNFHVSSGFGKRRDPFTKRWAMHLGLDFSTYPRSPVHVTAPGRVTYVGWKGAYGKMVEVDHGFGLRTRYGHLRKILVKRGQEVAFRDRIGLLGSTGRSTGPHLHYEVLVDGKQIDPANFLRAGRHVHKE